MSAERPEVTGQESGCEVALTVVAWEEEETSSQSSWFDTLRLWVGGGACLNLSAPSPGPHHA